jgi:hypothetical protein
MSSPPPPCEEQKQEGKKPPSEREKMETQETQEDEEGDIIQNQKRQAINNNAQTSKDREEDKMETHDEKQPERRWPGAGEKKQTPRGNRDMEESPMGWAGSRTDDKQSSRENENQKTTPTTNTRRTKKLNIDKKQRLLYIGGAAPKSREQPHTKTGTCHLKASRCHTYTKWQPLTSMEWPHNPR